MSKTIYMGSTQIDPQKTAAEIQSLLVRAKVTQIMNEYSNGEITALRFALKPPNPDAPELWYRLPVRWEPVLRLMQRLAPRARIDPAQAKRTAWRQILRWVEAQLALIEVNASTAFEVFLPYMHVNERQTVAEMFAEKHSVPLLPAGKG